MKTSDNGIKLIKELEGCVMRNRHHVVYDDATGRAIKSGIPIPPGATIGYGHLIKAGEVFNSPLNEVQATNLLRNDIATAESAINTSVQISLGQHEFDALVALVFNIGVVNFRKSTILKYINNPLFHSKTYPAPEAAWKAWNKTQGVLSAGLVARRKREWTLFSTGKYSG